MNQFNQKVAAGVFTLVLFVICATKTPAQWVEKNNGLYGGLVSALAVNGTSIFAGTKDANSRAGNGIFRSAVDGIVWTTVNEGLYDVYADGMTDEYVNCFIVRNGVIFAGTRDGMFFSNDNGISWNWENRGVQIIDVTALDFVGDKLFAGTLNGVFLLTGFGWTAFNNGLTNLSISDLVVSGTNLFASTSGGGVFRLTNGSSSWVETSIGLPTSKFIYTLAVSGGDLFAGSEFDGVFRSSNNGTSWVSVSTGLSGTVFTELFVNGTSLFVATDKGLFVSVDKGNTWNSTNTGLGDAYVTSFAVSGSNLFVGTTKGVFLSTDSGASWVAVNKGLTNLSVYSITTTGSEDLFATTSNGLFFSSDNGTSWGISTLTSQLVISSAFIGGNLYVGTYGGGAFRSSDNGASWTAINSGFVSNPVNLRTIRIKAFASIGGSLFVGTNNGVYVSTNSGTSWTARSSGLTNLFVTSLAVIGTNLFAATNGGGVFMSTNNGLSWTAVNTGLNKLQIAEIVARDGKLFAGAFEYPNVFTSVNNGASWEIVQNTGFPGLTSLTVENGTLLVGTTQANDTYLFNNNSISRGNIGKGLSPTAVNSLFVKDGVLFVAKNGGIWSRPLSDVVLKINSIEPISGPVGSLISILGEGFNVNPESYYTKFNETVTYSAAGTSKAMSVAVPLGATSGKITVAAYGQLVTSAQTFTVTIKQNQDILFAPVPDKTFGDSNFLLEATSSSGLPISYKSSNPLVATITDNSLTILGAGSTTITASQLGNSQYNPAIDVQQVFNVGKAILSATADNKTKTYGDANPTLTFTYSGFKGTDGVSVIDTPPSIATAATSSSDAGTYPITLTGGTDNNYLIANTNGTLTVNKANLTATADNKTKTYGDANPVLTFTYSGFKGTDGASVIDTPPSIATTSTSSSDVGTYPITLTGGTDNNYTIANTNGTLTITPKNQSIVFPSVADRTEGTTPFNLSATASSGLVVTFESLTPTKVTVSGTAVTILAPGSATIRAKQAGNNNFSSASNVDRTFCVLPAKPTITVSGNPSAPTLTSSAAAGNQWFFNGSAITTANSQTFTASQAGLYTVRVTIENCNSEISDGQTIVITGDIASTSSQMEVYPNPTQERVYVSLQGFAKSAQVQVRLVDVNGKSIYQQEGRGGELMEMTMAGLANGLYFIEAQQGRIKKRVKIVKK